LLFLHRIKQRKQQQLSVKLTPHQEAVLTELSKILETLNSINANLLSTLEVTTKPAEAETAKRGGGRGANDKNDDDDNGARLQSAIVAKRQEALGRLEAVLGGVLNL